MKGGFRQKGSLWHKEMDTLSALVKRNIKLFFKDKGVFFTSLITPIILLVLYLTFLGGIYREIYTAVIPQELNIPERVINGCVGGQLISSILAVSCVTVAFCSNMIMVQDKANGVRRDLTVSPASPQLLSVGYYIATLITTLTVCLSATVFCLIYIAIVGFYMSAIDILMLVLDVFLLVMLGTALSSIIDLFISTQGQISAVGTIVSSGYGFICGAYMPISQFSDTLQKILSLLPGTYGTSLMRNAAMRGALNELTNQGVPEEMTESLRDSMDCNIYVFDNKVSEPTMYIVLVGTVVLLVAVYVYLSYRSVHKKRT